MFKKYLQKTLTAANLFQYQPVVGSCNKLAWRKKGLSKLAIASTLGLSTLLGIAAPVRAEGSAQLGINQPLYEYGVSFVTTATGIFSPNHAIYVDVVSANEVINVSLCGNTNADDVRVEIYNTSPNLTDPVLVPTTGGQVFAQTLTTSNVDCANVMTGTLATPLQFTAPSAGTYEVRLFNESTGNGILRRADITVTPNSTTLVDPTAAQGRIYSYSWAFNAGGYTTVESANTDYYIKVPGGRFGENFVWQLDLNNFAGFVYEIIANNLGLDAPNQGLSADFAGNSITPLFPLYLSHPEVAGPRPTVPPEVTNFRFTDSDGVDNSISPGSTGGVQDSGTFLFNTDVEGTYSIIIDVDQDGQYAPGDTYIFGEVTPGGNSVVWDGTDNTGTVLPEGVYSAQLQVRLGEFHFVASDAETSGGTQPGLTVFESLSAGVTQDTLVFWDDFTLLGATTTLPLGQPSSSPAARHTWGNNTAGGFGNRRFIDTYVYGDSTTVTSTAIIGPTDVPIPRDYGDAPDPGAGGTDTTNYFTTEVDGGPNHVIVSGLHIGTAPDADDGAQQNTAADADDTSGNDEGAITFDPLETGTTAYSLSNIAVTNSTGEPAFLSAWIDFDHSGTFDNDERAIATVANGQTTATLDWSGSATNPIPVDITDGITYARFRYSSTDGLGAVGSAVDGEIEDYQVTIAPTIADVLLVKRITAINGLTTNPNDGTDLTQFVDDTTSSQAVNDNHPNWPAGYLLGETNAGIAKPGDELEYTVYFLNAGRLDAGDVRLCDRLFPEQSFLLEAYGAGVDVELQLGTSVVLGLTAASDASDRTEFIAATDPVPSTCNLQGANDNGTLLIDITGAGGTGDPELTVLPGSTGVGTPNDTYGLFRFRTRITP